MYLFNSKKTEYKFPFGAVPSETEIKINFPVSADMHADKVDILIRLNDNITRINLDRVKQADGYDCYAGKFTLIYTGIYYYRFEVFTGGIKHNVGRGDAGQAIEGEWLPEWQITVYDKNFKTPEWVKGGLIYQIFPDRFRRSGKRPLRHIGIMKENWGDKPGTKDYDGIYRASDFFGGDLDGIIEKLPYLKEMGVTIIYLNPIFESVSNHRYDTGDYMKIDGLLGDESTLKELCSKAKDLGIAVILDGVFNHTGSESIYFNKSGLYDSVGAYNDYNSPYHDWYYFINFPDEYVSWWGIANVPTVNKNNVRYQEFIMGKDGVIEKWAKCGISGWRLDVADELPIDFLTALCKKIKEVNGEAFILGEVWEDASTKISYGELRPYLMGKQLDGVMNYPFMHAIASYVVGGSVEDFVQKIETILENYPKCVVDCLMNMLSTHDTVRIINRLSGAEWRNGENKCNDLNGNEYQCGRNRLFFASTIQYTLPGVPAIYYGDEAGMSGWSDPYSRGCYPWGNEDKELLKHYRKLGELRKRFRKAFSEKTEFVSDNTGLLIYKRGDDGEITVICNNSDYPKKTVINGNDWFSGKQIDGEREVAAHGFYIITK